MSAGTFSIVDGCSTAARDIEASESIVSACATTKDDIVENIIAEAHNKETNFFLFIITNSFLFITAQTT